MVLLSIKQPGISSLIRIFSLKSKLSGSISGYDWVECFENGRSKQLPRTPVEQPVRFAALAPNGFDFAFRVLIKTKKAGWLAFTNACHRSAKEDQMVHGAPEVRGCECAPVSTASKGTREVFCESIGRIVRSGFSLKRAENSRSSP